jgi:hypothetical protein
MKSWVKFYKQNQLVIISILVYNVHIDVLRFTVHNTVHPKIFAMNHLNT